MKDKTTVMEACDVLVEQVIDMQAEELDHISNKQLNDVINDIYFIRSQVGALPNGSPNQVEVYKEEIKEIASSLHGQQYKDEDIGCTTDLSSVLNML